MCKESIWGAATTTTFCGTPGYLAPEIIQEMPYGASVDFWSLGVLIYEMLVGDSPFEGDDEEELFDQILKKKVEYPKRLDDVSKSLLNSFLDRNPKTRLGCSRDGKKEVMSHPFFAKIDWAKLEKREVRRGARRGAASASSWAFMTSAPVPFFVFKPRLFRPLTFLPPCPCLPSATPPKVSPPGYKPDVKDPRAADCFDPEFTEADTALTPSDTYAVANIDQTVFREFSFVNKNFFGEPEAAAAEVEASRRPALFDYPWYRPDLPREEAAKKLRGKDVGTFFVRESSTQPGCVCCFGLAGCVALAWRLHGAGI